MSAPSSTKCSSYSTPSSTRPNRNTCSNSSSSSTTGQEAQLSDRHDAIPHMRLARPLRVGQVPCEVRCRRAPHERVGLVVPRNLCASKPRRLCRLSHSTTCATRTTSAKSANSENFSRRSSATSAWLSNLTLQLKYDKPKLHATVLKGHFPVCRVLIEYNTDTTVGRQNTKTKYSKPNKQIY